MNAKWIGVCIVVVLTLGMSGCFTSPAARPDVAVFDLGEVGSVYAPPSWLGEVEVTAPSWLESRAMQYRLAAEPARRHTYVEHRWAANPSELLAAALRRQLGTSGARGDACRLRIELDEWLQSFDADGNSQVQLALRAGLYGARGDVLLARQAFSAQADGGRIPKQGVAAFVALEKQAASDLARWLTTVGKGATDMAARCRS